MSLNYAELICLALFIGNNSNKNFQRNVSLHSVLFGHPLKIKHEMMNLKKFLSSVFHNAKLTEVRWSETSFAFLRHLVGSM